MSKKPYMAALALAASLATSFVATRADAQDGMYLSGNIGLSLMQDFTGNYAKNENPDDKRNFVQKQAAGVNLAGAIGRTTGPWRLEGEVSYRANPIDNFRETTTVGGHGYLSCLSLMGNVYYDLKGEGISPFVMGGIGVGNVHTHYNDTDRNAIQVSDSAVMAYQIGAGVSAPITEKVSMDLAYRYFATTHVSASIPDHYGTTHFDSNLASHALLLGVRVGL